MARGLGLVCGTMSPGSSNAITDVSGVGVGHVTLRRDKINTGVTAIISQPGNLFLDCLLYTSRCV